jgi:hypothetical protein
MDNPEKLEQNEENQNNNTTQYVLDTTVQNVEKTWTLLQTTQHSFYAEILTEYGMPYYKSKQLCHNSVCD